VTDVARLAANAVTVRPCLSDGMTITHCSDAVCTMPLLCHMQLVRPAAVAQPGLDQLKAADDQHTG